MGTLEEARRYLAKAREFLEAAQINLDLDLFNAATSNAVTSGINAKDAICSKITGRTGKWAELLYDKAQNVVSR